MYFSSEVKEFESFAFEMLLSQKAFLPIDLTESGMSMLLSRLRASA